MEHGIGTGPAWLVLLEAYRRAWQQVRSVQVENTSRALVRSKRVIANPSPGFGRKLLKDTSIR